jgi:hypothetical protein
MTKRNAPALMILLRGPHSFEQTVKNPWHYFFVSLTFALRPPKLLFLHRISPWRRRAHPPAISLLGPAMNGND